MQLIVICSWCGRFIRFKDTQSDNPPQHRITHGICEKCLQKAKDEINSIKGGNDYDTEC